MRALAVPLVLGLAAVPAYAGEMVGRVEVEFGGGHTRLAAECSERSGAWLDEIPGKLANHTGWKEPEWGPADVVGRRVRLHVTSASHKVTRLAVAK